MLKYRNPVWEGEFADPFVIKVDTAYYAYGTSRYARSAARGGYAFPILRSDDLVHWTCVGGAVAAVDDLAYWAPAVAERNGHFYLYYSAGLAADDSTQRLYVARASDPAGPFVSLAMLLSDDSFCIDAEPFCDPSDGRWYLFFAKDYFDGRVGTGLAAVALADTMDRADGDVVPILKPSADWHIYARDRTHYGQHWPAWHTVEGPCVALRSDLYYCFYSGGAWHSDGYGVSYGVAAHPLGPYADDWSMDGPAVLRTGINGAVGPGHNSLVTGPDGQTDFLVYHAWDAARTTRRMCIDPLFWTPDGPRCVGPTTTPQTFEI